MVKKNIQEILQKSQMTDWKILGKAFKYSQSYLVVTDAIESKLYKQPLSKVLVYLFPI